MSMNGPSPYPAWLTPKPVNKTPRAMARLGGISRMAKMSKTERRLHQARAGRKRMASMSAKERAELASKGAQAVNSRLTQEQINERMRQVRAAKGS